MMIPNELLGVIARRRYIAQVRTETAKEALGVIEALARGGITIVELSLAIPGAEELLRHFAVSTTVIVGAGGVVDGRQASEAARAGARFISAPVVAPEVVAVCAEQHLACILGALTPTEILNAQRAGAEVVNVFPISAVGGSAYLRSLYRQLSSLSLMVSGGIALENVGEFLALPVRAIGLSSAVTPHDLIERGDWTTLAYIARQFVAAAEAPYEAQSAGPRTPLLDTTRGPAFSALPPPPSVFAPADPYASASYPAPPSFAPAHPAASLPREEPQALPVIPRSSPSAPMPAIPPLPLVPLDPDAAPDEPAPHAFRPWDSKPADDWIN